MQPYSIILLTAWCLMGLYAASLFIKDNQNAKNKIKQEAKERAEAEQLFIEAPTGFLQRSCEERCYKDFDTTELVATSL